MDVIDTMTLAQRLAGGDSYIRTKDGVVKGLAITIRDNPEAPEVIVVGKGPRIVGNAELLMSCEKAVPVYIKQAVNAWAFRGYFRATSFSKDIAVIDAYRRHRDTDKVAGILFLEEEEDLNEPLSGGGWSIATETRNAVENAAVEYVTAHYKARGYEVESRERDKCGFDLLATKGDEALRLEVKGTAGSEPAFWLTRNERAASVHPMWKLAVVTNALSDEKRELEHFTAAQMEARFHLDPYLWNATTKTDV